jgi:hypothetical protein
MGSVTSRCLAFDDGAIDDIAGDSRWAVRFAAALVVVCCALIFGPVAGAAAAPAPRTALLQAGRSVHPVASQASSSAVQKAADDVVTKLAQATVPSLWIDADDAVAPAYGTTVFVDSVAAVTDLQRLERLSVPGLGATIVSIVGADRALAERAITQADGADHGLLAAANRDLAAGGREAAGGHPASAVDTYTKAWESAFAALTQLVAAKATGVPPSALAAAAENALGSRKIALAGPMIEHGQPPLTLADKPELFFAGSEACPFCATQRWGMIVALSQFGTFSNLHLMQSTSTEPPQVRTFTFFSSSYHSPYISFVPVEVISNVPKGFGFAHLQPLTASENALLSTFDPSRETPFIDVANRFTTTESTVLPQLVGGMSWTQIASSLTHPRSLPAQAIGGEAEVLTAEICEATGGDPSSVCSAPVVNQYEAALPLLNGKGGGCPTSQTATAGPSPSIRARRGETPVAQASRCGG